MNYPTRPYYANTLHGTTITNDSYHHYYILGVLNSKMTTWFYRSSTDEAGKVFAQIKIELLRLLPIPKANFSEQKPIIDLVSHILRAQDASVKTDALDESLDVEVYKLYGLTPDEIAIIESTTKNPAKEGIGNC